MMDPGINMYRTVPELESAVAARLTETVQSALASRGVCLLALSGGETPRGVYRRMGTFRDNPDWDRVHILFADERMVPPDDPRSNFGMVRRELLDHLPVQEENVHRIRGEATPADAAQEYARDLSRLMRETSERIDVILLGMGEDGHTASLFPGTGVLHELTERVRAVFVPRLDASRVTLTLPAINGAREVIFLVAGKPKADMVRHVLTGAGPTEDIPASLVRPSSGNVSWFLDKEAASGLPDAYRVNIPSTGRPNV